MNDFAILQENWEIAAAISQKLYGSQIFHDQILALGKVGGQAAVVLIQLRI